MQKIAVIYSLGTASATSTVVTTILNTLFSVSLRRSLIGLRSIDFATVGLSAVSCIGLVALTVSHAKDIEANSQVWKSWETWAYVAIGTYLFITTGVVAGAVASSSSQFMTAPNHPTPHQTRSLFVAWCIMWAISVLSQGLLCGFLLGHITEREPRNGYPYQFPPGLGRTADMPDHRRKESSIILPSFSPVPWSRPFKAKSKASSERLSSIRSSISGVVKPMASLPKLSKRYSERTLFQRDSKHEFSSNFPSSECISQEHAFEQWDTSAVSREDRETVLQASPATGRHPPVTSRSRSEILPTNSLDSLVLHDPIQQPPASFTYPGYSRPPSRPRTASVESHIHPLFRSDSPSPPPTPTPGTMVTAAPTAGQTISSQALHEMRARSLLQPSNSLCSLRTTVRTDVIHELEYQTPRPGPGKRSASMPAFVLAAGVRNSLLSYERRKGSKVPFEDEQLV
ncbi:hypothetical protein VTN00DRAFT_1045 [Thermoascus crustaceus]|uniref:uncharacterized protein n=1 Tax=Thermoascus crustaceus TaxID=5088 RepID=UPI003742A3FE